MDSAALVAWASLVSWLVLGASVTAQRGLAPLMSHWRRRWRHTLLQGTIVPFGYYLILFGAYARLPAQEAQAINYTWALMLSLLSVPMLGHTLGRRDMIAGAFGYLGVLILATRGDLLSLHFTDLLGVGLALLSTVLWALYWIGNTRESSDATVALFANFTVGLVWVFGYLLWRGGGTITLPSPEGMAGAAYIGLFEMSVTFLLWGRALKLTHQTATIANLIFLSPPISLIWIHRILHEPVYPSTWAALGLITVGLLFQKRF